MLLPINIYFHNKYVGSFKVLVTGQRVLEVLSICTDNGTWETMSLRFLLLLKCADFKEKKLEPSEESLFDAKFYTRIVGRRRPMYTFTIFKPYSKF